ncbi:MAG: radical SAM protein [Archaeoglobales archaeon]|jgi:pyruvate formate lyase activating enzyme|nr:radical SAM protein [Archaeoglobi archaeon]NHW24095.1 radical SAM protein [Archaeoglobales archaeon]TDA27651.1 MAG: radical SAM protein [Archaeoglobi archaeon]
MECVFCGKSAPSKFLGICAECAKSERAMELVDKIHSKPAAPVKNCKLCANECKGFALCGRPFYGNLTYYEDPLPTNCCNSWFCKGSKLIGTNLAVFYYGCNFDCVFCQNWSHKNVNRYFVDLEELLEAAKNERVKCICHFGGSPEPQLPFALKFSRKALELREDLMICWEWNGAGNSALALKAAELSSKSDGTVKFDLKAWSKPLHLLLTGRDNDRVKRNFELIGKRFPEVLSATTLLVPYYVDEAEIEGIASFIASVDEKIPYSLLVFHPDYMLKDLPVTPRDQVIGCYKAAKKHLKNVNVGNLHLLVP